MRGVFCVPVLCWSFLLLVDCQEVTTVTLRYQVLEEPPPGSVLGRLSEDLGWTEGGHAAGPFQLLQPSARLPIQVDSQDGVLRTSGRLDREQLCPDRDLCVLSFSVLAARHLTLIHVEIHVLDINDHGPRFPQTALELEISESALLQTRIPLDRADDPDAGSNGLCSYLLSPSDEHFALEVTVGSDGAQQVELVVVQEVDRELHSSFLLTMTAVDHGKPPRSGSASVRVTVLDSNDNSPTFAQNSVAVEIKEDAVPGTLLAHLSATDPDQGPNGEIEYAFSKHTSVEVLEMFTIESRTGRILLQQRLDYEKRTAYEVDVQAQDQGANPSPAHCKLLVRVLDVNDNQPDVHVIWAGRAAVVSEAQPKDTFVGLVMLSDPDSGDNGRVDGYISQGTEHFALSRMNPSSYMLLTKAPLDREGRAELNLTLLVQDRGTPSLTATRDFTVHVGDINDNVPCFEASLYHVSVAENSTPPFALLAVRAHDVDAGLNGKVTYRITDAAVSEWLAIDAETGEIWTRTAFDAEKMAGFDFTVTAEDAGRPQLASNVSVRVTVLDVNDNPPFVTEPEVEGGRARVTVLVDTSTGRVLGPDREMGSRAAPPGNSSLLFTISATDADAGLNGALLYSMQSSDAAGWCVLDPLSGRVYLTGSNASSLVGHEWDLEVSVRDRGEEPLCTQVLVKVTFGRHCVPRPDSSPVSQPLGPSAVVGICLLGLLALFLVSLTLAVSLCRREKHGTMTYNCREAEHAYSQQQPRKPPKPIQKSDIHVVPVLQREEGEQPPPGGELPPGNTWADPLEVPCHMTPTLYRTLRNQGQPSERLVLPAVLQVSNAPPTPKLKTAAIHRTDAGPHGVPSHPKVPSTEAAPQHRGRPRPSPSPEAGLTEACSREHILRSLVRLSLGALAERGPAGQLAPESLPVQQISQLLSLLHQGQVQPRPNHKGNKYAARHACCRNGSPHAEGLNAKSTCGSDDFALLGEELGNLWDAPSELDLEQLMEADPAWMARLSLPLSTDYKANVVSPGALQCPPSQEAVGRDEPHTFATFGKAAGEEPAPVEPQLTNTFLSEMSTLFEMVLSRKASSPAAEVSVGLWHQLSVRSRTFEREGDGGEAAASQETGSSLVA